MFLLLIIGLLSQNSWASETNQTEMTEALKLVEKIMNQDKLEEITTLPKISEPDILSYIHNLTPDLLNRPEDVSLRDDQIIPLVHSRETNSKAEENRNDSDEHRRFINWFRSLFGMNSGGKKRAVDPNDEQKQGETTKLTSSTTKKTATTKSKKAKAEETVIRNADNDGDTDLMTDIDTSESSDNDSKEILSRRFMSPNNRVDFNDKYMLENRRFWNWIKNLFSSKTTNTTTNTTAKLDYDYDDLKRKLRSNSIDDKLVTFFDKINNVFEKLNDNLENENAKSNMTNGFLILKTPFINKFKQSEKKDDGSNLNDQRSMSPSLSEEVLNFQDINKTNNRRFLNWLKNLFGAATTTTVAPTSPTTEDAVSVTKPELRANNMEIILDKLIHILENFNQNLEIHNAKANLTTGYLVMNVPEIPKGIISKRQKREVTNETEVVEYENDSNITDSTRKMFNPIQIRGLDTNAYVNIITPVQKINNQKAIENASDIKSKLVKFIAESFKDIKLKLEPLKTIKEKLNGEDLYVIGYVMSSMDTLEVNLTKLIDEMEQKKNIWDERKMMELFEKMNTSNNVIGKLMVSLSKYTANLTK